MTPLARGGLLPLSEIKSECHHYSEESFVWPFVSLTSSFLFLPRRGDGKGVLFLPMGISTGSIWEEGEFPAQLFAHEKWRREQREMGG